MFFLTTLTFLSNFLSVLVLPRNTAVNFFPFFLLPLPSYGKNHITNVDTPILSYLYFLSKVHQGPGIGYKTLATRPIWSTQSINPLFAITLALIAFRSSPCWISSSLKWWVEPTWLPSSNHWNPVCAEMKAEGPEGGKRVEKEKMEIYYYGSNSNQSFVNTFC